VGARKLKKLTEDHARVQAKSPTRERKTDPISCIVEFGKH
jgi:hypothetical protein